MKMFAKKYALIRISSFATLALCGVLISFSCYKETAIPVEAFFSTDFVGGDESAPVQLRITNLSQGAESYEWVFEGASPSTSADENPGTITYNAPGTYTVALNVTNVDGEQDNFTQEITVFDGIAIDFSVEVLESNFPPVEVAITNNTDGAGFNYEWLFQDGDLATSAEQNPPNVFFETPGEHRITLTVNNGFETFERDTIITVLPDIDALFESEVNFEDDDFQAPVTFTMINSSISATSYEWTFPSGAPTSSTEENPTVTFNTPGTYTIELLADNGKRTDTFQQEITISPNTNLRSFTDVRFGVNATHNNNQIGAFFSTITRESYTANQVNSTNGAEIDLVFSGLNSSFNFNQFVSPNLAPNNGFMAIPNAMPTKVINSQEVCMCGGLTVAQFDAMTTDALLAPLVIDDTPAGLQSFNQILLPRIVLFQTADGRKGAIKIKGFVSDGNASFVQTDIKIQKEP